MLTREEFLRLLFNPTTYKVGGAFLLAVVLKIIEDSEWGFFFRSKPKKRTTHKDRK